jgi:hypothetical protein
MTLGCSRIRSRDLRVLHPQGGARAIGSGPGDKAIPEIRRVYICGDLGRLFHQGAEAISAE